MVFALILIKKKIVNLLQEYFCSGKRDSISAVLKNYILKQCKNLDIFQIIQN